jgi:hypothetical protein
MKISELIEDLQKLQKDHGDLNVYEYDDWRISLKDMKPDVRKMHYKKWEDAEYMRDVISDARLEDENFDIYDVDLTRPIQKGLVL